MYYFIVNPIAGKGITKAFANYVGKELKSRNIEHRIEYTQYSGHAKELAEYALKSGYPTIVSVGGDGTLYEVINGIGGSKKCSIGIIPLGTGNDFARTLGLPEDSNDALEKILEGKVSLIDIGKYSNKYFLNIAGVGIDVEVLRETLKMKKIFKGRISYFLGVIKALISFKPIKCQIKIDDNILEKEIVLCAIGNGKYFGGGMKILPESVIDDGYLNICIVDKIPKIKFLWFFPKVYKGKHMSIKEVTMHKGKKVSIIPQDTSIWINVDGEIFEYDNPIFEIVNKGVQFII